MERAHSFTLFALLLAAVLTCFAPQLTADNTRFCDPSGTWFGASQDIIDTMPYQMTITPVGFGRHAVRSQQAISLAANNISGLTDWTGELILAPGFKYNLYIVSFLLNPDNTLEMDAARATLRFVGNCGTLQATIDTFVAYTPYKHDLIPFVSQPQVNILELINVPTITETYQRMPSTCPNCPFAGISKPAALAPDPAAVPFRKR